jgi:hypothetical protein
MVKVFTVALTTNGSGAATGYTPTCSGLVRAIAYVPHATTPLDTNADIVVTGNTTGVAILTKANIGLSATSWHPRVGVCAVADGAALLYASGGTAVADLVPVADEAIKIVVAQGDSGKSGTFYFFVDGASSAQ